MDSRNPEGGGVGDLMDVGQDAGRGTEYDPQVPGCLFHMEGRRGSRCEERDAFRWRKLRSPASDGIIWLRARHHGTF